ncbi:MAG: 1-acyl-sn-glycerol-3-phosphate acyltransferase [bacterium]|nr:1-acyl-sn-glycerol-3-phosphate acyltransferase [bacterium]
MSERCRNHERARDKETTPLPAPSRSGIGRRLERLWRVCGTAFMFAAFGVGAVILALVVVPLSGRLTRGEVRRDLLAQRWIQRSFALFVRLGVLIRVWKTSHHGMQHLAEGPSLVVANHPTLMDVVFLLAFMPQADCVVKRAAWSNPALRGIVRAAGYIPNDSSETLVEACADRLRAGRSVVLFPEGSRSPDCGLRSFRRGMAHIALRSGCRIVPVVIDCDPPALKKGQPWYALPNETFHYTFSVGSPTYAKDLVDADLAPSVAARRISSWMRNYFEARLNHGVT